MFSKRPSIKIDKIENLEINYPYNPEFDDQILKNFYQDSLDSPLEDDSDSKLLKVWDYASKIVSVLTGLASIFFLIFLWTGNTSLGTLKVDSLLTVFSFAFVGSLISIGGVNIFSINASLRKEKEKIKKYVRSVKGCPFVPIIEIKPNHELRQPGNPRFCYKCPLGIDISSDQEGGLIHNCKVYLDLHNKWKELPGAAKVMRN